MKFYTDEKHVYDYIQRHLTLAAKHDKLNEARPCLGKTLAHTIHRMVTDGREKEAIKMMRHFKQLLPWQFRVNMYLRSVSPPTTAKVIALGGRVKEMLGLKRE